MYRSTLPPLRPAPGEIDPTCPTPEDFLRRLAALSGESPRHLPVRRRRKAILAGVLLGLTGLSVAGAILVSTCTLCYAVSDGGAPLAYVQGKETYQAAVRQVEAQVSTILQDDYDYSRETQVSLTLAPREKVSSAPQAAAALMDTVPQVKAEYVLTVDGVPVAACADRADIDRALRLVKDDYTTGDTVAAYYDGRLGVAYRYLPAQTEVLTGEDLRELLRRETETHDALPVLAPDPQTAAPTLDVYTVEEVTYTQTIPAPVEQIPDPTLLVGQQTVLRSGTDGVEMRMDRVICRSGREEARENLSTEIISQAVPTQVAVGTGQGTEGAKGRFIWPCSGTITSPFGPRTIFGSAGFHRGTDIAAPWGTDIAAGADGTVIWAGPKGSYGNLVKLDHGNGYTTYYAHCSQLLVQEGDRVTQGQVIARVGSTGRSTGPHCHFEILWQNEPLDAQLCF